MLQRYWWIAFLPIAPIILIGQFFFYAILIFVISLVATFGGTYLTTSGNGPLPKTAGSKAFGLVCATAATAFVVMLWGMALR